MDIISKKASFEIIFLFGNSPYMHGTQSLVVTSAATTINWNQSLGQHLKVPSTEIVLARAKISKCVSLLNNKILLLATFLSPFTIVLPELSKKQHNGLVFHISPS